MKCKLLLIVIFFSICSNPVISQPITTENISLSGHVVAQEYNQPLAYASVGVLNKPQGTVTDTTGRFVFQVTKENFEDTLQVSLVGYFTKKVAVKDFVENADKTIRLSVKIMELAEVTVTNARANTNTEIIGRQATGKLVQVSLHHKTSVVETIGSEMGMHYSTKNKNALLKDFNFYISANNFNLIKFRINIYTVKNDLPEALLYDKQIFATVNDFKTGWIKLNLEDYKIKIPGDFIVTVQWIESRMDKKENPITIIPVAVAPFSKNCYVRVASQDRWKRMGVNVSSFVTLSY